MDRTELAHQVSTSLGDYAEDYDVEAIVVDLITEFPEVQTRGIDAVYPVAYWALVARHDPLD